MISALILLTWYALLAKDAYDMDTYRHPDLASDARARIVAQDRRITTERMRETCQRLQRGSIIVRSTALHAETHLITDTTPSQHIINTS